MTHLGIHLMNTVKRYIMFSSYVLIILGLKDSNVLAWLTAKLLPAVIRWVLLYIVEQ
jgi:hypothetical protein